MLTIETGLKILSKVHTENIFRKYSFPRIYFIQGH